MGLYEELRQEGNEHIRCTSILPYVVTSRKDIIEVANWRIPPITVEYTAKHVVDATLRNELMVTIPRNQLAPSLWRSLLPFSIQNLFRDHILREKGKFLFSANNKKTAGGSSVV